MSVVAGMFLGVVVACGLAIVFFAFQAALLRVVARWAADVSIGWGAALLTTVVSGTAQACASGMVGGADVGLVGLVVGFAAWAGVTALINGIEFAKAALIGVLMAIVQWAISLVLLFAGLAAFLGGLAGAVVMSG